ncbi:HNH endonuclease signature motif containing protein [Salsipaludibacter albus]|uniref:HNH endonuclease signature motif containing protein n=1 Tax=Salsipaludibacter albus TaxID=2849650 RepID=UPI001EE41B1C|nr:HNH endonuclease signature motif containing protein [Salsipaludibacter albus]MBY5162935.1 HNH endonuclease [Salsipaludibacter albus]
MAVEQVAGADVARLGSRELRERLGLLDRLDGVVAVARADTVRALAMSGAVAEDGAASTTDWLKSTTGRSGREAARVARLATDLADLPATRDALANGSLNAESADAVVRATRDGRIGSPEEVEEQLLPVAMEASPEELRSAIRDRQQAVEADAMLRDERRQHARRSLRMWRDETRTWQVHGQLADEAGQLVRTALDALDQPDDRDTPDDRRRRPDQRLADAFHRMASRVLDAGLSPSTGGVTRPHVSVIVDASTVATELDDLADLGDPSSPDRSTLGGSAPDSSASVAPRPDDPRWADLSPGELPWGGTLSPQAVRRVCCDAAVSRVVMDGPSQVLDVGRATRQWSGPQRRAVNARDRQCRGPHCSRPIAWTSIHHLQWWSAGGRTSVDNGLALCHDCHRRVHDHGWTVDLDLATARATWTSPTGVTVVTAPGSARSVRPGRPDRLTDQSRDPSDQSRDPTDQPSGPTREPRGPSDKPRGPTETSRPSVEAAVELRVGAAMTATGSSPPNVLTQGRFPGLGGAGGKAAEP